MKTLITLIFVLFIGVAAQAQNTTKEVKVETVEMSIVITAQTQTQTVVFNMVTKENTVKVARLYKFKNSRIKKALSFTTKRNKSKMA